MFSVSEIEAPVATEETRREEQNEPHRGKSILSKVALLDSLESTLNTSVLHQQIKKHDSSTSDVHGRAQGNSRLMFFYHVYPKITLPFTVPLHIRPS